MTLSEAAPAKLNLALHVRARGDDGYHSLESIFAFVDFSDRLQFQSAATLTLGIAGPFAAAIAVTEDDRDAPQPNLVLRAVAALAAASGNPACGALTLWKAIPVAAGLGGGSADAAAALRLLARHWRLDWSLDRLAELAATLGADVPACVYGTLQLGQGRGEQLSPLHRTGLGVTPVLLVNPGVALPTGPVFGGWDGIDRGALDPNAPLACLRNDLEASAIAIAPVIAAVLTVVSAQPGVTLVRMSGSGATVFALFESESARRAAAQAIGRDNPDWWLAETALR